MDSARAALALSLVPGVGPAGYRELVERHGSAGAAWSARPIGSAERAARLSADEVGMRAAACGAITIAQEDSLYPAQLLDLGNAPPVLFAIGDMAALGSPCVAIVGTRSATAYGERVTRELASSLARAGATIVSGMARGIDAAAHLAALDAGGKTIAVLGTGVDLAYPTAHRELRQQIASHGLLLSEELPGDRASSGSFPKRNRIIAALSLVTIVVEAPARSGALITANHALELGRTVAAVPGPIDSPHSTGSNELLRDGAMVIASVEDAVALVGLTPPIRRQPHFGSEAERAIWDALSHGTTDIESLTCRSALPARECMAAVTALELAGAIECALTGEIRRR
ncbi:MAG: DNA-protecting protein DprA [Anaerolineae bacterium]|nr:DNA-protecting protein DprA [Gemmatimonadaceae bacterium]